MSQGSVSEGAARLIGRHAAVVGGGIGGLAAAQALADHFESVTLFERDDLPEFARSRAGTPQDKHPHVLLVGGQRALAALLPGFEQELAAAGAVPFRVNADMRYERPGFDPFPQRDFGWTGYCMSRPLIEHTVRRMVARRANIRFRPCSRALSLTGDADGGRVTGLTFRTAESGMENEAADLVIDATGRGALTLDFLAAAGRARPQEIAIGADIAYGSAVFERGEETADDWKLLVLHPCAPETSLGGLLLPVEGNRWIVGLGGAHGDAAPADWEGFLAYARALRMPTIYDAIRGARRLGEIARFGFPDSVWRRFDLLEQFPRGLLPLGDTVCRFNPLYGQGMSVAAQQALLLHSLLDSLGGDDDPLADLASAYFPEVNNVIETPWSVATMDFIYPMTRGERPPQFEEAAVFSNALLRLAAEDADVHRLMTEVIHLLKPASVYREPGLRDRVQAVMARDRVAAS